MTGFLVRRLPLVAWMLTATTIALAVLAWGPEFSWDFHLVNVYVLFTIFGLIAFSTMWSQYITGAVTGLVGADSSRLAAYYRLTGFIVLAAILLHPGLLTWQLWRDGFGLPPFSELRYIGPMLYVAIIIGMTCLFIFLAFEFRRLFGARNWWRYMDMAVDAAMLGIFYHGLKLGAQIEHGWYGRVWWFYGLSLILALGYKYALKYRPKFIHRRKTEV